MLRAVGAFFLLTVPLAANPLEQAVKALQEEDWTSAVPWLEKAAGDDPENVDVQFNLAYCYGQLQENSKAVVHYRKVVDLKPGLIEARMNLGILLMEQGEAGRAAPHFRVVSAARPDEFAAVFSYAQALLESGAAESAAPVFRTALGLDPDAADAHLGLGQALLSSGRAAEAWPHYRRAVEIAPELHPTQLELAEHFERHGAPEKALELYSGYLDVDPEAAAVRQRVGWLLLELERYPEAARFFEQAVERDPSPAHRAALAEAYWNIGETAKALPHLREAAKAENADPALRFRYANWLLHDEQYPEAARNYLALLERAPENAAAWNGLAFAMYKNEDLPAALKALARAAQAAPSQPAQVYLRAIIEDKLELRREALASYRRFIEMKSGLDEEEWKARERAKVIERSLQGKR